MAATGLVMGSLESRVENKKEARFMQGLYTQAMKPFSSYLS